MTIVFDKSGTGAGLLGGTDDGGGDAGANFRVVHKAAVMGAATGTQIRLTLLFGTASGSVTAGISNVYAGQAAASGNAHDFNGNQVHVLFGGAATANSSPAGIVVSDWITLGEAYDNSKNYVVSVYVPTAASALSTAFGTVTNVDEYFGGSVTDNSAINVDSSITNSLLNSGWLISKIEIQAAGDTLSSQSLVMM